MINNMGYRPNKTIHPGYTLAKVLESNGMSQKNLGDRTGLSEKHISQIVNGEASISIETALLLENALITSASFWINLEKNYQETTSRLERMAQIKGEAELLPKFPYLELSKRGYVERTSDVLRRVENLWKFFGVNSLEYIPNTEAVDYRKRDGLEVKSETIATWLKCGEIDSKKVNLPEYSEPKLKKSLSIIRSLSIKNPKEFSSEIKKILREAGVSLVYTPHFPGSGVSGAFRWINNNPVIQLSIYYKWADIFWFNLFHEIGHILLHGKKDKFIEFDKKELSQMQEKEKEADEFACDALIPPKEYFEFLKQPVLSRQSIIDFAESLNISPGIVAGRLGHENKVPWHAISPFRYTLKLINRDSN